MRCPASYASHRSAAETALLTALSQAPEEGASVVALVAQTGMSRRWIYYRLHELAATGIVVQTIRGHWRLATPDSDDE